MLADIMTCCEQWVLSLREKAPLVEYFPCGLGPSRWHGFHTAGGRGRHLFVYRHLRPASIVLGAYVHRDGGHDLEHKETIRVARAAFHSRQALWRTPGQLVQKLRVLQMTVLAWTAAELRGLRSVQTRMTTRGLGGWWPRAGEDYP